MRIAYVAVLPAIPGNDLVHPSRESAQREVRNARAAGLGEGSCVQEVLMRAK